MYVEASSIENWGFRESLSGIKADQNLATAVIWLKKDAAAARTQIASNLGAFGGIAKITQIESQPSILRVRFDFDLIRYNEIIQKINEMGYEARVVGY